MFSLVFKDKLEGDKQSSQSRGLSFVLDNQRLTDGFDSHLRQYIFRSICFLQSEGTAVLTPTRREGMVEDNSVVLTCDMVDIERREERHSCISLCTSLSKECGITEIHSRKLLLGIVFFPVESYASDKRNL